MSSKQVLRNERTPTVRLPVPFETFLGLSGADLPEPSQPAPGDLRGPTSPEEAVWARRRQGLEVAKKLLLHVQPIHDPLALGLRLRFLLRREGEKKKTPSGGRGGGRRTRNNSNPPRQTIPLKETCSLARLRSHRPRFVCQWGYQA